MGDRELVSGPGRPQPTSAAVPAPAVAMGFCSKAPIVWEDQTVAGVPSGTIYSILAVRNAFSTAARSCHVAQCARNDLTIQRGPSIGGHEVPDFGWKHTPFLL